MTHYDVRKSSYYNNAGVQTPVSTTSKTASKNVPVGGTSATNVSTTTKPSNAKSNANGIKLDRQLEEALKPMLKRYGIDFVQFKQECAGLLNGIRADLGCKPDAVLTTLQIQQIVEKLENLIKSIPEGEEVTIANLKNACDKVLTGFLLEKAGVSEEEFAKMLKNGEVKSLRELLGLGPNDKITAEMVADYLKKKNEEFKAKLDSLKTEEEKKAYVKEYIEKELKTLLLTAAATPAKDRKMFFHAIEHVQSENKAAFFKSLLESLDYETRVEIANQFDNEKIKAIILNPDVLGKTVGEADAISIKQTTASYQDAEHLAINHEDLKVEFENYCKDKSISKEDIKSVMEKIRAEKNGEAVEYSEKEKELVYFLASFTGENIGTANNCNITKSQTEEFLALYNADLYKTVAYEAVMTEINDYVESNPSEIKMTTEQFTQMMDKATNNNYSNIAEYGSEAVLNPPIETSYSDIPTVTLNQQAQINVNPELGFVNTEKPENKATETKTKLYSQSKDEIVSLNDYEEYEKDNGKMAAVKYVFTNCKNNKLAIEKAKERFAGFNTSLQYMTLRFVNNFGLSKLLPEASIATLERSKGQTYSNTWATKLVQERVEEQEDKERRAV